MRQSEIRSGVCATRGKQLGFDQPGGAGGVAPLFDGDRDIVVDQRGHVGADFFR